MKEHKAGFPITVEIHQGTIAFGVNNQKMSLKTGDLIYLDANVPHDLLAEEGSIINNHTFVILYIFKEDIMKYLIFLFANFCLLPYASAQQRINVTVESSQPTLLNASAGNDLTTSDTDVALGDTPAAIGGLIPYSFQWLPETDLDDATSSNPIYSGDESQSYTLVVTDNRGCTATDTINIMIVIGISEIPTEDFLLMYPNPGDGMIRLSMRELTGVTSQEIRVHRSTGQLVLEQTWVNVKDDFLIDVSSLAAGSYIVAIGEGENQVTRQLIIRK
jgi:hypothetical protein